jgi:hypothetical protein
MRKPEKGRAGSAASDLVYIKSILCSNPRASQISFELCQAVKILLKP